MENSINKSNNINDSENNLNINNQNIYSSNNNPIQNNFLFVSCNYSNFFWRKKYVMNILNHEENAEININVYII